MIHAPSSLIEQCKGFLRQKKLVGPGDPEFFSDRPHKYAPQFIVAWIMNECDELNLDGTKRPPNEVRATYGTAQKMRASMTYAFGRLHGLGSRDWHCSEGGSMVGNPSVSEMVSQYMLSLHRRKVRAGEAATSARAITAVCHSLRHVPVAGKTDLTSCCKDIKPFVLHEMPDSMAYLCPVQAYAKWLEATEIESGYVFRRLGSGDRVSENNQPMVRFDFRARALSARCTSSLRRATY
ncbi:hypothetical protein EDB89DRAFT_1857289 [Lactarius sanguifluus]|nr:hypothetical protein EDB89DRAFT_1857289 [Lactarius sanguifluus]